MQDTMECYKVLELEPGASAERVRAAYLELTRLWDPDRYIGNPLLRTQAEKKRKEIDDAYQALRRFLPELQNPLGGQDPSPEQDRDFTELAAKPSVEVSRAVMGIIAGIVLLFIFVWAAYLVAKSQIATPPSVPIVE